MKQDQYHEWPATHTGWILFAPVFLANLEDDAPVPIPRWGLWKWYELNMWINDNVVNWLISLIDDSAVGYMFWGVRKMGQPRIIRVKAA